MSNLRYPFPSREGSICTLKRDYCYGKIPKQDIQKVIDMSWQIGVEAANAFLDKQENCVLDFSQILSNVGFYVKTIDKDYISGHMRYFAELQPKIKRAFVYRRSVLLWAQSNGYSYKQAENLILMHEYFHYLEYTELGSISKRYSVYMLKLFGHELGRTGIAALSEIAADGFAYTLFPYAYPEAEKEKDENKE